MAQCKNCLDTILTKDIALIFGLSSCDHNFLHNIYGDSSVSKAYSFYHKLCLELCVFFNTLKESRGLVQMQIVLNVQLYNGNL